MNKFAMAVSALVLAFSFSANAAAVSSTSETVAPDSVDQVIRMVDQQVPGSSHLKASVVVLDLGMSTDVSPRYTVYLTLASLAEWGNIGATFKITDQAYQFKSARKISNQVFEVVFVEYRDQMYDVTITIDAKKLFADEAKARQECGDDFCDIVLQSTVDVKEVATVLR
ncbi:MAG: hypothetical protein J0L82_00345 [Deltaproteobacteria bacterium]|jgi:hypothetical protein|nr:hypothetical protein [Deltaproteobacteria bacterium]